MKRIMLMLVFILVISSVWSYYSDDDDFLLGCYSYLKPEDTSSLNDDVMNFMQQAHYNSIIWESKNSMLNSTNSLLENAGNVYGMDSFVSDYYTYYDTSGDLTTAGTYALSTGNHWKFEAEYKMDDNISSSDNNEDTKWRNFHKYSYSDRIGHAANDANASNGNVWRVDPTTDVAGSVLGDLRYRWSEGNFNNTSTNYYNTIGGEFRFALYDGAIPNGSKYLAWDKLYITYVYHLDPNATNLIANSLMFGCKFMNIQTGGFDFKTITLVSPVTHQPVDGTSAEHLSYTYEFLNDPNNTTALDNNFRSITFCVDLWELRGYGDVNGDGVINYQDDTYVNTAGYWWGTLFGIDPHLYWYGNHKIDVDYVRVHDKMFDTANGESGITPNPAISWLSNRLNDYTDVDHLQRFYTMDEPQAPQFASQPILQQMLNSDPRFNGKLPLATINNTGEKVMKPSGERFSLAELYLGEANPSELMVDYYPLQPEDNWNIIPSDVTSVQWKMDWMMLKRYHELKQKTQDRNIPFYVVPICSGQWDDIDLLWRRFQLPTPAMQKCLQLLPLCYGVDGVINWKIYSDVLTRDEGSDTYYVPYEANPSASRSDINHWYGLINKDTSGVLNLTPQYASIIEANEKLLLYGPILKSLRWLNAGYLNRDGINLQSDIYVEDSTISVSSYLSSLTALDTTFDHEHPQASNPYDGYIQAGLFRESEMIDSNPYYMLVNRRTDFVDDPGGQMMTLTPHQLLTSYDSSGHADGFSLAPSQNVIFTLNTDSHLRFGDFIGLYDPFDNHVYPEVMSVIDVEIAPGDGKLLEMCGTAPLEVNSQITLSRKARISNNVTINSGGSLTIASGTDCKIFDDVTITINSGGSLNINSDVKAGSNVVILANTGSSLSFDGAVIEFTGSDSKIKVVGGLVIANECSFVGANSTTWGGFDIVSSVTTFQNSYFKNLNLMSVNNSDLILHNCRFDIAVGRIGLRLYNSIAGHTTSITADASEKGFYGMSNENTKGIMTHAMLNKMAVTGIEFHNLAYGMFRNATSSEIGTTTNCHFNECKIGINILGSENKGCISSCYFYENSTAGISTIGSIPQIDICEFTFCSVGVRVESLLDPRQNSISNSNFYYCGAAIESKSSSVRVCHNNFFHNNIGLFCHDGSNMNLSNSANNILRNCFHNISFSYPSPYRASIQLFKGHNDFYHDGVNIQNNSAYDFGFDMNYWNEPISIEHTIDVSRNWFQNNEIIVDPISSGSNVYCDSFDPEPNVDFQPVIDTRFFHALDFEEQGLFEQALSIYKTIIDERLSTETMFITGAIEGVYRTSFCISDPNWNVADYFDAKVVQNLIDDPRLSELLKKYQVKSLIVRKDYQAAIDIIQLRIDNPYSTLDSLQAVLELETLLELAALDENKVSLSTTYPQYKHTDSIAFTKCHNERWNQLYELMGIELRPEAIDIVKIPTISSNYPNPFNPSTTITYNIPNQGHVKIVVYNIRGQLIKTLFNNELGAGKHKIVWNGTDNNNNSVGSGIYFIRLVSGGNNSVRKVMLVK